VLKDNIVKVAKFIPFYSMIFVSDGKGLSQLACQGGWKKCKEEEEKNADVMYICVFMCAM
jgi:hypothetical protein